MALALALLLCLLLPNAAMATTVSDNFNRGDGALTAPWTTFGSMGVVSQTAQATSVRAASRATVARYDTPLSTHNDFVQGTVRFSSVGTNAGAILLARMDASTDDSYSLWLYTTNGGTTYKMGIYQFSDGYAVLLFGSEVDVTALISTSNVVRFEIIGTSPNVSLTGYIDGSPIVTVSNQTINDTRTRTAIATWESTTQVSWDDFSAGDLTYNCTGSSPTWTTPPDQTSVTICTDNASDGDTIHVTAGTATWTSLNISNKAISVIGAGAGTTNISGSIMFTIATKASGGNPAGFFRLSGFQFTSSAGACTPSGSSAFVQGASTNVRIDHNTFISNVACPMLEIDTAYGVVDHNNFTANVQVIPIHVFDFQGETHGDEAWAAPDDMGTNKAIYFEDNNITLATGAYGVTDGWRGSRVVWRHNSFLNMGVGNHGTEASGRDRSMRLMEVYENDFTLDAVNADGGLGLASTRGGTGVIYNNRVHLRNGHTQQLALMNNMRRNNVHAGHPWGPCGVFSATFTANGGIASATSTASVWTDQATECGTSPNCQLLVTGTTNYNGVHAVTFVASPTLVNFSIGGSPGSESGSFSQVWDGNNDSTGHICMDQPGAGQSNLIQDTAPGSGIPTPNAAVQNASSPIYCWGNTVESGGSPSSTGCIQNSDVVVENTDFFNGTPKPGYTAFTYPHPLVTQTPPPTSHLRWIFRHRP